MTQVADFYAALVESTVDAIVAKDLDGIVIAWNPAAEQMFGYTAEEMIGRSMRLLMPPGHEQEEDHILTEIREGRRVTAFATQRKRKDGKLIDVSVAVSPVHDKEGRLVGASAINRDISQQIETERRLRESNERFHLLADNMPPLAWMAEPDGHIFWYNKRWYDYTGTTLEEMEGWGWTKVHHPDHVERVKEKIQYSWDTGEQWEDIFPLRSHTGEYRWFLSRAMPIRDAQGRITRWFGTNSDITQQREQAEQIRLLLLEVNHRSKNMLSTVQALARRTAAESGDFLERFQERVQSLAINQDLLVQREWREVPLDELVRLQLRFLVDAPGTIASTGDRIALAPRAAEIIGMALHELATNALKYGSLSVEGGSVEVAWQVDRAADSFCITWRESGGPRVEPPSRKGFGTTLIVDVPRRYFDTDVQIDYDESGVSWELHAPLQMVEAAASTLSTAP